MDTLHALLEGLTVLASDASPIATGKRPVPEAILSMASNSIDLLDLTDSVRVIVHLQLLCLRQCTEYPNSSGALQFWLPFEGNHPEYAYSIRECSGNICD